MIIYTCENKFISVPDTLTNYFERNFKFDDYFAMSVPTLTYPKNMKVPYGGVSKQEFNEFIFNAKYEFEKQLKKIKIIIEKFNLGDE